MNKKYMDFVPSKTSDPIKSKQRSVYKSVPEVKAKEVTKKPVVSKNIVAQPPKKATARPAVKPQEMIRPVAADPGVEGQPQLGVFENLNEKFVTKDVPKRPLGQGNKDVSGEALKAAKAKNLKGKNQVAKAATPVEKPVENPRAGAYNVPKSPFINQEKVVKRPLSKNVYPKGVKEAPKTEPAGPVTVISKPEKDSHVNVVITIIITIVLGAAAGTIAFLLLPK